MNKRKPCGNCEQHLNTSCAICMPKSKSGGLHWKKDGTAKCGEFATARVTEIRATFSTSYRWSVSRFGANGYATKEHLAKAAAESWLRKQAHAMLRDLEGRG